jgi:sulfonate transport system substrate-binding protein
MERILIIILAVFYLVGCDRSKGPEKKAHQLSVGLQSSAISSLVILAKAKGYFSQEGLDVTLKHFPSGKLALLAMFDGKVDLSTCTDMPIMVNSFKRSDFVVLSSIANTNNGAWIIARKDKNINTPKDLIGKTIGTQKSSAVHFFLSMFLLHHQISESDVTVKFMKAVDLPNALINGKVDAFSMRNPYINQAKLALKENAVEFFFPGIYHQYFNLVTRQSYVNSNPLIIQKFLKTLGAAEKSSLTNRKESIELISNELEIANAMSLEQEWATYNFTLALDQSLLLTLEDEAEWFIRSGLTSETEIPKYLDFIYFDGLKQVKPGAVSIIH